MLETFKVPLSSPRLWITPSALAPEIPNLVLHRRLRDPESRTYPSFRQNQSRNLNDDMYVEVDVDAG